MDDESKFWIDRKRWPDDAMGYVFLANAVHRLGKFLFPDDWDGSETYTDAPYQFWLVVNGTTWPIEPEEATKNQKVDVHRLLLKFRPEFKRDPDIKRGPFGPEVQAFTREEWGAGIEEAKRINAENASKLRRKHEVRRFIKEAVLDESLRFVLLPVRGGAFSKPQDRTWWNRKDHDNIFVWCQINPKQPLGIGVGGDDFQYVFVDETDLEHITSQELKTTKRASRRETLAYRQHRRRRDVLEMVRKGTMRPEEANQIAVDEGLEPFVVLPPPGLIALHDEILWSIEVCLAWIIWRDAGMARNFHELHRRISVTWQPILGLKDIIGFTPKRTPDVHLGHVTATAGPERAFEAKRALWRNLEAGKLSAVAFELSSGQVVQVPSFQWGYLEAAPFGAGSSTEFRLSQEAPASYKAVKLRRDDVLSNWPAASEVDQNVEVITSSIPNQKGNAQRRSKRLVAQRTIGRLFPDGVPSASEMSDAHLAHMVAKAMKEEKVKNPLLEEPPSRETILRAAGRK
ncbi:hypothetical protein ACU8MX_22430 [Rhizobium leguminosarum]